MMTVIILAGNLVELRLQPCLAVVLSGGQLDVSGWRQECARHNVHAGDGGGVHR